MAYVVITFVTFIQLTITSGHSFIVLFIVCTVATLDFERDLKFPLCPVTLAVYSIVHDGLILICVH